MLFVTGCVTMLIWIWRSPVVRMKSVVFHTPLIHSAEATFHVRDFSIHIQAPPYDIGTLYQRKASMSSLHTIKQSNEIRLELFLGAHEATSHERAFHSSVYSSLMQIL